MCWTAGMRLWPVASCNLFDKHFRSAKPSMVYDCQLWLIPIWGDAGWVSFLHPLPNFLNQLFLLWVMWSGGLLPRVFVLTWLWRDLKKNQKTFWYCFHSSFDNCFQGGFQQSQLMSDKLEEQSSTFCLAHCTRAQPQHACLPQQNEKSIHVSHLPHLLQDNWPWHHDLSVWVILFPLGWARGKRHISQ